MTGKQSPQPVIARGSKPNAPENKPAEDANASPISVHVGIESRFKAKAALEMMAPQNGGEAHKAGAGSSLVPTLTRLPLSPPADGGKCLSVDIPSPDSGNHLRPPARRPPPPPPLSLSRQLSRKGSRGPKDGVAPEAATLAAPATEEARCLTLADDASFASSTSAVMSPASLDSPGDDVQTPLTSRFRGDDRRLASSLNQEDDDIMTPLNEACAAEKVSDTSSPGSVAWRSIRLPRSRSAFAGRGEDHGNRAGDGPSGLPPVLRGGRRNSGLGRAPLPEESLDSPGGGNHQG